MMRQEIRMAEGDADWVNFSDSQVTKVSLTIILQIHVRYPVQVLIILEHKQASVAGLICSSPNVPFKVYLTKVSDASTSNPEMSSEHNSKPLDKCHRCPVN